MKLYKIIIMSTLFLSYSQAQSIVGSYRLTGLSAVNYYVSRTNFPIMISDSYNLGIEKQGDYYIEGELIFKKIQPPVPEIALIAQTVSLEVSFNADGSAFINEGTYPTETTNEETCVAAEVILPIDDSFNYLENITQNYQIPYTDIFGNESLSPYRGLPAGYFSLDGSVVFDNIPSIASEVSVPFNLDYSVFEDSAVTYLENEILPGLSGGYIIYSTELRSMVTEDIYSRPNLYLEWHAIDGTVNDSGFGDLTGVDEDGDGTDFDSIYGLENLRSFKIKSGTLQGFSCGDYGGDLFIAGNVTDEYRELKITKCDSDAFDYISIGYASCEEYIDAWFENCIDEDKEYNIGETQNLYSLSLDNGTMWDGITTWNSDNDIPFDDSGWDLDPGCLTDGNDSDCSGRMTFKFEAKCIPSFSARYFMVELTQTNCDMTDVCGVCNGNGEVIWYADDDGDGYGDNDSPSEPSCLPAIGYVANNLDPDDTCENNHLNFDCSGNCLVDTDCAGECNGDAIEDLCGVCDNDSSNDNTPNTGICDCDATPNGEVWPLDYCADIDGDGLGAGGAISYCLADLPDSFVENCSDPEPDCVTNDIAECGSCGCLSIDKVIPLNFEISSAYPNPFNPIVSIAYSSPTSQYIEGHIYNISGELVHTLISQYQSAGNYSIKWNATGKPSGIYIFILKTKFENKSQKLVLLK